MTGRRDREQAIAEALTKGDALRKAGDIEQAIDVYRDAARSIEIPPASICLKLAQCYQRIGDVVEACLWATRVVDAGDDFSAWQAAAGVVKRCGTDALTVKRKNVKLFLAGSYTTTQFAPILRLAALRLGVDLQIREGLYGQYRQEIIDPSSALYAYKPDFVILAVHAGDVNLPDFSTEPETDIEQETQRWAALWKTLSDRGNARIVQHGFVLPYETPMGHLGGKLPGSRHSMLRQLNVALARRAGNDVSIVDGDHVASLYGKQRWFDPRWWFLAKHAVAPDAQPMLARHTAAVIAADLGLSKKCVVLDLDNTLWGGVIGEDGLAGIRLGDGVEGEAYVALQEYLLKLKARGVILAVCSKNDEANAKEPFEKHPEMRIRLDDFAMFVANWQVKVENIRRIAETLNIGLDSLVFIDDDFVERDSVRQMLPDVDVIPLPEDPTQYVRTLASYLMFETASFTPEDARRTEQYRARSQIADLSESATSIDEFYRSLEMKAVVAPFDELHLPRIAQLIGKTNQFNLTTRRHSTGQLERFMADPNAVTLYIRLRDRFADHGLISVMIAVRDGDVLDIDTWLMSCRVIGRTVEAEMLKHLCQHAATMGCTKIRGTYIPTARNSLVRDIFSKFSFKMTDNRDGTTTWVYDLQAGGTIHNEFIEVHDPGETAHDPEET